MDIILTPVEARVLGSLIEKEITTPDYYPLSLNALISACNQKSNRNPVMDLDGEVIMRANDRLRNKKLVVQTYTEGSRVLKYAQNIGSMFNFSPRELGTLCVLLLRGPQTVGEIRSRTARLAKFNSLAEVGQTLQQLMDREDGPFVVKLARQVGRKENRYAHLFCGEVRVDEERRTPPLEATTLEASARNERIKKLEQKVADLRTELDEFKQQFAVKFRGHDT